MEFVDAENTGPSKTLFSTRVAFQKENSMSMQRGNNDQTQDKQKVK